jgi:hypothetical protein
METNYISTLITPILTYLRSSLKSSLKKRSNYKASQKMTSLRRWVKLGLMKKKDNRIDINDKQGGSSLIILVVTVIFFSYIFFWGLGDYFSVETGICKKCPGPLKILNNPLPWLFTALAVGFTNYLLFRFVFKSKWMDIDFGINKDK